MSRRSPSPTLPGTVTPVEKHLDISEDALAGSSPTASGMPTKETTAVDLEDAPTTPQDADFLVEFTGDDDPRSPRSMSTARKWMIVMIVSTTSLCVACASSIYAETYGQIMEEFDVGEEVVTLGLSLFVIGLGLSPMVLAPLSEFYGRKPVYIGSLTFFVIWIIPCGVARNIETLLIARFLDGFAGAAFLSIAGGTMGDLFAKSQLQAPMTVYTVSPLMGPQLGPLIGGFINYYLNWRWTFWVLLIWVGVQTLLVFLLVPETYHPVLLRKEARRLRKSTGNDKHHAAIELLDRSVARTVLRSIYRPFVLLAYEPMCLNLCLYCSLLLGIVYLFFGAFGLVFSDNHGFNLWQVGLSFLGLTTGVLLGGLTNPLWARHYRKLLARHHAAGAPPGSSEPEFRLPQAILGAPLVTIGLLWFGWTTYPSVPWIVPIIGSAFFGAGVTMIFSGVWTFLVDAYPMYAASALAANSFTRSMFAGVFPLFGNIMYERMGYQWATFVLAMVSLAMAPFPLIFYKYGKWFRARSRYAGAR